MPSIRRHIFVDLDNDVTIRINKTAWGSLMFVLSEDGGQRYDSKTMEVELKPENIDDLITALTEAKGL